jgi:hypothetical protein
MQEKRELETLLAPLRISGITTVEELRTSPHIRQRDIPTRRGHRSKWFTQYFSRAKNLSLDLEKIALFPGPALEPSRLAALENAEGFCFALGIVLEYSQKNSEVALLTSLNACKEVRVLRPGSMLVDPHTFEDRLSPSRPKFADEFVSSGLSAEGAIFQI